MAVPKRSRDEGAPDRAVKKQKRGFTVGPANLPDGTWKRKTQQIKKDLIQKAKIRKEYAKVKAREQQPDQQHSRSVYDDDDNNNDDEKNNEVAPEPSTERHPDRTQMIQETPEDTRPAAAAPQQQQQDNTLQQTGEQAFRQRKQRKPKVVPFAREHQEAQQRKQEAEERRKAYQEAQRQRAQKIDERERFRKAMAKARTGGKNGQRKLGRESKVLLDKVRRMVSET